MCEVVIQVVDKLCGVPAIDALAPKEMDIIAVEDDGFFSSRGGIANPSQRLVGLAGVSKTLLLDLLEPEFDGAGRLARKRKKFINYLSDTTIRDFLLNNGTKGQLIVVNTKVLRDKFQALRAIKPAAVVVVG